MTDKALFKYLCRCSSHNSKHYVCDATNHDNTLSFTNAPSAESFENGIIESTNDASDGIIKSNNEGALV